MILRRRDGFTLTEVMVAVGILSVMTLAISTLVVDMKRNFRRTELRESLNQDHLEFETLLMNRAACSNTFGPANMGGPLVATPMNVPRIMDAANNNRIEPGVVAGPTSDYFPRFPSPFDMNQYRLVRMTLSNFTVVDPLAVPPLRSGTFRVAFEYSFTNPEIRPNRVVKTMEFTTALDATDNIVTCNNNRSVDFDLLYINVNGDETKTGNLDIVGNLQVFTNGAVPDTGYVYAQQYFSTSDERLKRNISSIDHSLELIQKLRGVEFNWKSNSKKDWGVIAQDVEKVAPYLVRQVEGSDYKTVNYNSLIALSIEAIKELDSKNQKLESELTALEKETSDIVQTACLQNPKFKFCPK